MQFEIRSIKKNLQKLQVADPGVYIGCMLDVIGKILHSRSIRMFKGRIYTQ